MKVVLCVLGAALGVVFEAAALGQSPLKVAHCRANCILELTNEENGRDCPQKAACQSCWDQCERLGSGWTVACDEGSQCDLGCRLACRFHNQLAIQRPPVSVTRGQEAILIAGNSVSWPSPSNTPPDSGRSSPHVFVLMCRREDNSWIQVTQTLQLGWHLPESRDCGAVRVMVVGPQGLVTVYSPIPTPLQDAGLILRSVGKDIWNLQENLLKGSGKEKHKSGSWFLREVSLIHQGVLVIAEVSWESQSSTVYLVTWELAGGGLKGHLLTDSTSVTLSLWPDTVYQIQVQEVRNPERVSETLVLDTRRATPLPLPAAPVKAMGHPGFEGVAGVAAAFLLFFVVALGMSSWMLSSHNSAEKEDEEQHENDHFKLFPPPVRLLIQTPALDTEVQKESRHPALLVKDV